MGQSPSSMVHVKKKPLTGCVIKVVDSRPGGDFDACAPVAACLRALGATLRTGWSPTLSHVVIVQRHDGRDTDHTVTSACQAARKVREVRSRAATEAINAAQLRHSAIFALHAHARMLAHERSCLS
jgi:hypothetical protein